MYLLVLFGLLVGLSLDFPRVFLGNGATAVAQQDQQELQQLRLEKQIQKQVREEIDRTFKQTIILLYISLIFALGLPLFSFGFYWLIQRKLATKITKAIQSLEQLSQQLIKLESSSQSSSQEDYQPIQQSSDRSNFPSNLLSTSSFNYQPGQKQNLEQSSVQVPDTTTPNIQHHQDSSNLSSILTIKEKIMQEMISHLPSLSQEKIFAGQEANLTNSIQQLTVLLKNHPDLPLAIEDYTNHAHVLYFLGQELEAIALYNHSLSLEPDQPQAWHQKGTIHLKQSEYQEAIAAYNQAINLQADYAPSWYKLAYAYALAGELDFALSHLQRAVNLNPTFRTRARMSPDFEILKQSDRFQSLINLEPSP